MRDWYRQIDKRSRAKGTGKNHLEHRIVMENILGRPLSSTEIVHHKDHDKRNNDPDNLELTNRSNHAKMHIENIQKAVACSQTHARERLKEHGIQCVAPECNTLTLAWHHLCHKHSSICGLWGRGKGLSLEGSVDLWLAVYKPRRKARKCTVVECETLTSTTSGFCRKHHSRERRIVAA